MVGFIEVAISQVGIIFSFILAALSTVDRVIWEGMGDDTCVNKVSRILI